MFKAICLLIFFMIAGDLAAQININGGFECIQYNGKQSKWYVIYNKAYTFSPDSVSPYNGKYSGRIQPTELCQKASSIVCFQTLELPLTDKFEKLTIKYHFKINKGWSTTVQHFINRDCPADTNGKKVYHPLKIKVDSIRIPKPGQWYEYKVEIPFTDELLSCKTIRVGFIVQAFTDVNVDDIEIFIDDKKLIDTCNSESRKLPGPGDVKWLEKNIISLANTYDYNDLKDISKLKKAFGNASIIALGEGSHGTKEFNTLRTRIIKYLIDSLNFEVVTFENSMAETHLINTQLADPAYSTTTIVDSLFHRVYQTDEMRELLDIVRNENKTGKKVYIEGFDDQNFYFLGHFLSGEFKELDTIIYQTIAEIRNMKGRLGIKQYDTMYKKSEFISDRFLKIKGQLKAKYSGLDTVLLQKRLRSYINTFYLKYLFAKSKLNGDKDYDIALTYRDSLMADNVMWLRSYYHNKKMIILCHNTHVQKSALGDFNSTPQGHFIQKWIPSGEYKTFAFLTGSGNVTSYKSNSLPEVVALQIPYKSCYEYYFSAMPDSVFFFSLLPNKEIKKHESIVKGLRVRSVGYGVQYGREQFRDADLLGAFDGIFFINTTSPSASFWYKFNTKK